MLTPFTGAKAEDAPSFELDQVVVTATKTPVKLAEAGANISVITKEEIEKMHYRSVADALRQLPGVEVIAQGQTGALTKVYINGTDRVLVMVNGRNVGRAEGIASGRANVDLSNLTSLDNVERIEVVKGNASALYGSHAVGGVINIITKKGGPAQTSLQTAWGSWGTKDYRITQQGEENNLSWLLTANKQEQKHFAYRDYLTAQDKKMPNSDYDGQGSSLSLQYKLDEQKSLDFNLDTSRIERGTPKSAKAPKLLDRKLDKDNSWDLTYKDNNSSNKQNQFRVYRSVHQQDYRFLDWNEDFTKEIMKTTNYENITWGGQWQTNQQLNQQHLLTGGIEWWKAEVDSTNYRGKKSMTNTAFYLQDQWQINEKLNIVPGVRVDKYDKFGTHTTPRLTLNYKITPQTNTYVSYGKVFNAPQLDDLYFNDPYTPGNPDLKPEKGYSYTMGVNHKFDHTTEGKINYFSSKLDDAIGWAPDPNDPSGYTYRPYNAEKAKISGVEILVSKKVNPHLNLSAGYNYKKVEEKVYGASDYANNTNFAPINYKLGLSYNKDNLGLELKGRGIYGKNTKKFTKEDYWIWDAALNLAVSKDCSTFIKVNNLTNQSYEEVASEWGNYYPMPGRSYLFGVNFKFQ